MIVVPELDGHVDLRSLCKTLGEEGIDSILLEGGANLNWSALKQGVVKKVMTYIAPKLFGGERAKTPVAGNGVEVPKEAFLLKNSKVRSMQNRR